MEEAGSLNSAALAFNGFGVVESSLAERGLALSPATLSFFHYELVLIFEERRF
jgi:hypothetical protein